MRATLVPVFSAVMPLPPALVALLSPEGLELFERATHRVGALHLLAKHDTELQIAKAPSGSSVAEIISSQRIFGKHSRKILQNDVATV